MVKLELENIVVCVPANQTDNLVVAAVEALRLTSEISDEVEKAREKCLSIQDSYGRIVELKMMGECSIENIGFTYVRDGIRYNQTYPKKEFYEL